MSKKSFIDSVKVGSPCGEKWDEMTGNDRVRFCSHCAKSVNNLSTLTRKEATRFVRRSGSDICIRYIVDPVTRRPMFAEQLLQITRRAPGLAAGALTASIAVSTTAYGQASPTQEVATPATAVVFRDRVTDGGRTATASGHVTGTITDPNGALVSGARVTLTDPQGTVIRVTTANEDGVYSIDNVANGTYHIKFESPGFKASERDVTIRESNTEADTQLGIGTIATVEVKMDTELSVGAVSGGVMVSVEYTSPLSTAIADEDKDLIRDAIANGADTNAREKSYDKITPMFLAVSTGDLEIVQMLLDAGAKVNVRSTSKETPLMRLDSDGTRELVELLVRNGAKVNVADTDGNTPLIHAAENSTDDAIAALIEAGADVNAANSEGETALMKAASRADIQSVRALIFAGAKVNARDKDGENAWDKADDHEVEALLVSFGSEVSESTVGAATAPTPEPTPPTR